MEDSHSEDDSVEDYEVSRSTKHNRRLMDTEDAILGFNSDDDESEGSGGSGQDELSDIDMGSDLEDKNDKLPDERAWGTKRKSFYNTDYVDQDYAGGYAGEEAEAAELEEQEARNIQRRLLEQLNDADFSLSEIVDSISSVHIPAEKEVIQTDLSKLSKRQKIDIFNKESPEFSSLVEDFMLKITEARETLLPIVNLVEKKKIPETSASKFVQTKFRIILNYCTNIAFYILLKVKRISVQNHPVLKALFRYRQLLLQLEPTFKAVIAPQLEAVINSNSLLEDDAAVELPAKENSSKKKLNILKKTKKNKEKNLRVKHAVESEDNIEAPIDNGSDEDSEHLSDVQPSDQNDEKQSKRAITYEMAKNKGLTPKRSKEQRNPRVKHRNKFKKAKIRRRGQVRTARTEIPVYGGEPTGIKIGLKKGIKLA